MDPAKITRGPCPRCGGALEFMHTIESLRTGAPVDFFWCETAATFIQLNTEHPRWKRQQSASGLKCMPQGLRCHARHDVRFGSKADICGAKDHVRFTPESGHVRCTSSCPLCAKSGHSKNCLCRKKKDRLTAVLLKS